MLIETLQRGHAHGSGRSHRVQVWIQLQAIGFTLLWVTIGTTVVLLVIRQLIPLRVSSLEEQQGLDINAHGEEAYNTEFTG
jgi:Amt family ammonium transporter